MTDAQHKFVESIKDGAIDGYIKFGILPSVTIAQGILESGWGQHHIEHNLFGMKWTKGCGFDKILMKTSEEYVKGHKIPIQDYFRGYDSFNDSIVDHNNLLGKAERYKPVRLSTTYSEQCKQLKLCGYATDSNYPSLLIRIIETSGLTKYDVEGKAKKGSAGVTTPKSSPSSLKGRLDAVSKGDK